MKRLAVVAIVVVVVALLVGVGYVDYTIYKAKYPNTEFWMYLFDSRK